MDGQGVLRFHLHLERRAVGSAGHLQRPANRRGMRHDQAVAQSVLETGELWCREGVRPTGVVESEAGELREVRRTAAVVDPRRLRRKRGIEALLEVELPSSRVPQAQDVTLEWRRTEPQRQVAGPVLAR